MAQVNAEAMNPIRFGSTATGQKGFAQLLNDTGAFRVQTIKSISATESLTQSIIKQDLTTKQLIRSRKSMNDVIREQYRIQKMTSVGWTEDANGRITADTIMPRDVPERLGKFSETMKAARTNQISWKDAINESKLATGTWAAGINSASENMIKQGKNMQWAGRQLMVGFTIPMLALGAVAGKLAYDMDVEFTKIAKVYEFSLQQQGESTEKYGNRMEQEQANLRKSSYATAKTMASTFGASGKETLGIIGDLAATGESGIELQRKAAVVSRAAFLGDLDRADAMKATITLQTVFGRSTQELSEDFAYMTAVANGTSLSMEDFVISIPKVAGVVKSLGGDIQDIGALMTATKAAGISAAEGANMLKTVLFRANAAGGKAKETFLDKTKVSLDDIIKTANGNGIDALTGMAQAMSKVSNPQDKIAIARDLFGLYQGSKALQLFEQLADVNGQLAKTYEINGQAAEDWFKVTDQAQAKLQSSASGRLKISLETMKQQLAAAGQPFLEVGAQILGMVTNIIKAFGAMPEWAKSGLFKVAALVAVIGPMIMLMGLFRNLTGQVLNAASSAVLMATRFKAMTTSQRAAELAAKQGTLAFRNEAFAAKALSAQLAELGIRMQQVSTANMNANMRANGYSPAPGRGAPQGPAVGGIPDTVSRTNVQTRQTRHYMVEEGKLVRIKAAEMQRINNMRLAEARIISSNNALQSQAIATQQAETAAVAGTNRQRVIGRGLMLGGLGGLLMMVGGTNKWFFALGMVLIVLGQINMAGKAAIIWQSVMNTRATVQLSIAYAQLAGQKAITGAILGSAAAARGLGAAMWAAMGPLGLALAAAAGIGAAMFFAYKSSKKQIETYRELGGIAKGLAESTGLAYAEMGAEVDKGVSKAAKAATLAGKITKEYDKQVGVIATMGNTDAAAKVQQIGIEFFEATGDSAKANDVMKALLKAAGKETISKDVYINFKEGGQGDELMANLEAQIGNIGSNTFGQTFWEDATGNAGTGGKLMFASLTGEAEAEGEQAGKTLGMAINNALSRNDVKGATEIMDKMEGVFLRKAGSISQKTVDKIASNPEAAEKFKKAFDFEITDAEKLNKLLLSAGGLKKLRDQGFGNLGDNQELQSLIYGYRNYTSAVAEAGGMSETAAGKVYTLNGALTSMAGYTDAAGAAASATAAEINGVGAAASAAGVDIGYYGDKVEILGSQFGSAEDAISGFQDATKTAMQGAWTAVLDQAANQLDSSHEAAGAAMEARSKGNLDAIEADADRKRDAMEGKEKAYSSRWEAQMDAFKKKYQNQKESEKSVFDARIDKVKQLIKNEQDAEKQRQKIFEAEKVRMQRLNDMYNKQSNFNMLLNSGKLDEAAIAGNDMRTTQEGWALDDAGANGTDASGARVEALEGRVDGIEKQRDARMKTIDDLEEREKKALEDKKDREKDALDAEKDRYTKAAEAAKAYEEKRAGNAKSSAARRFKAAKEALDMEMLALRTFIPQNEGELRGMIGRIEEKYGAHGFALDTKSKEWSTYVARAIRTSTDQAKQSLETDIKWKSIGTKAADELTEGILGGMTFSDFNTWMATGVKPTPKPVVTPGANPRSSAAPRVSNGFSGGITQHGGGPAGVDGGRAGRSRSAPLYSDEIPTVLQKGEYVLDKKTVNNMGMDSVKALHASKGQTSFFHGGGPVGGGMVSAVAGKVYKTLYDSLNVSVLTGAMRKGNELAAAGQTENIPDKIRGYFQGGGVNALSGGGALGTGLATRILKAIGMHESNLNYGAQSPISSASGAYQYIDGTWNNYKGYSRAMQAPPGVQDERAMQDLMSSYNKFGDWQKAVANHFYPAWANDQSKWNQSPSKGNPTVWDYVNSIMGKAGLGAGAMASAMPGFAGGGTYKLGAGKVTGDIQGMNPEFLNRLARWSGAVGKTYNVGSGYRSMEEQSRLYNAYMAGVPGQAKAAPPGRSNHNFGLASDGPHWGNNNPAAFGLTYPMSYEPWHVEPIGAKAMRGVPGLKVGGTVKYDNTIANLHKDETVLTAPLSRTLNEGIKNIDGKGGNEYNITMDMRGAIIKNDVDIESALEKAITKRESRAGRRRTIN